MAAEDDFNFGGAVSGPYIDGEAVTASDTVDLAFVCNALWVGTAQTSLSVVTVKGTVLALGVVNAGTELRIRCKRVNATGSVPGTGIVALR